MINFDEYTQKNIQKQMLEQVPKDIDTREGSIIQTAVGPVAWYLEGSYMQLDQVQKAAYSDTAEGENLDLIVKSANIKRKEAAPAVRIGLFNIQVPVGSQFKTISGANSVVFEVADYIGEDEAMHQYSMRCKKPGIIGNSYSGNLLPITSINGLTTAVLGEILVSGSEEETDEALRLRYDEAIKDKSFGGNIASYRTEIMKIEGVGAVQVYPVWNGGGTVLCSILDSNLNIAQSGLIETVQNIICPPEDGTDEPSESGYGVAPIGAKVTISTATAIDIDVGMTVQLDTGYDGSTVKSQISEALNKYLDSVKDGWGVMFTSHKVEYRVNIYHARIIAAILDVEGVVNVTNLTLNGSSEDISCIENAELQQLPYVGEVNINVS